MLKGIKIRLYLTNEQEKNVNSLLGSYRFVFNQCLSYKKQRYKTDKQNTTLSDLGHYFHGDLRTEYEWLKDHNTKVLKQSIINLEQSYRNFFKQSKGFPKYKSRHDEQKVRFPQEAISSKTFNEETSRLNLTTTIKGLKFECSDRDKRYLYENKQGIKSVTISKTKSGKYFATILIDGELLRAMNEPINQSIGIDLGIKQLLTLSNGESIDNPKWVRTNEKQLKKTQKQLSKKVKGSNNRNKVRLKLAKLHEKIKNQRQNYLHNITSKIINENQVIVLEDLNVSGVMKNHKLAKSIQELGLFELRRQLEYKSKWYGRELVFVSRWFPSSKTCFECGWKNNNLTLADREFVCEECGNVIDRDLNASINIEREGIRIYNKQIGTRYPEFTLVDNPTMDDKVEIPLKKIYTNLHLCNFLFLFQPINVIVHKRKFGRTATY
jgi:putative transposase